MTITPVQPMSPKINFPLNPAILTDVLGIFGQNVLGSRWSRFYSLSGLCPDNLDMCTQQRLDALDTLLSAERDEGESNPLLDLDPVLYQRLQQDASLRCYLLIVHDTYLAHHEQVQALHRGDIQAWEAMRKFLLVRAEIFLRRAGQGGGRTWFDVEDAVQKACVEILVSPFPYDVSFDGWCARLLRNQIHRIHHRSQDLHDRGWGVISLEAVSDLEARNGVNERALVQHGDPLRLYQQRELRRKLRQMLTHVTTPSRQRVLESTFFHGWADEEIAQEMGKTRHNVQVLRHRALQDLRTVLDPKMFGP